jgi:hypothetical protein
MACKRVALYFTPRQYSLDSSGSGQAPGNEPSGSIKGEKLIELLRKLQVHKTGRVLLPGEHKTLHQTTVTCPNMPQHTDQSKGADWYIN